MSTITRPPKADRAARPNYLLSGVAMLVFAVVFLAPFAFILLTAAKSQTDSALLDFALPSQWLLWENLKEVITTRDYVLIVAAINSAILTVASVAAMVVLSAMTAFVLQRRKSRWNAVINTLMLSGLIIPPAVVPTIYVLQELGLFKTMPGLILVEIAFGLSFCVLLFQAFVAGIPRELDEAAVIDGAGPVSLFFKVIFPLLKPVIVTVTVVQTVFVWNTFVNPLYFLPGVPTVQLTLYNFQSQYNTSNNLLFMNMLLITIPPLLAFMFFQKQIVAGMTAGSVKG